MRLAIHAPTLGFNLSDRPFGKDIANRGLFTALAVPWRVRAHYLLYC